ncbi:hypothetical protein D9619_008315 [Psilocybe cf. subviscida]|uniref:Uncharacterized protein n=1 Tax=Psilocybe cf. subviscida TaxID=2480587 RepID=A0A8H5F0Z8_9AGAR|nr:hypothetical protein D9619_008315 [Psilocybe cf. subviscida]
MSITINGIAVTAYYQPDVPFTTISSSFLRRNGFPHLPGHTRSLTLTLTAYLSPYVYSTGVDIAVVDTESLIDIVLDSDWYILTAQPTAGHAVLVGQVLVSFPYPDLLNNPRRSFATWHSSACSSGGGGAASSSSINPLTSSRTSSTSLPTHAGPSSSPIFNSHSVVSSTIMPESPSDYLHFRTIDDTIDYLDHILKPDLLFLPQKHGIQTNQPRSRTVEKLN